MVFIYCLQLENNKYYIGKTNNPKYRLDSHFCNNGGVWTKLNKPIQIIEIIPDCDDFDEDKYTIKYMSKYGINNVRGGTFSQPSLDKSTLTHLAKTIKSSTDACFNCGKKGHFSNKCPHKKHRDRNNKILEENQKILDNQTRELKYLSEKLGIKHDLDQYLSDDEEEEYEEVWACSYCHKEFSSERGAIFHENVHCKKRKLQEIHSESDSGSDGESDSGSDSESDSESEDDYQYVNKKSYSNKSCFRCGRKGHYSNKCYASTHVKGYRL